jgi:hypothetical protein
MGLPASQRRVLDVIENTFRGTDPRLVALFAMFGRLTHGEEMPRIEELRHSVGLSVLRLRLRLAAFGRWLRAKPLARQRAMVFFPLALGLMALTIFAITRFNVSSSCSSITSMSNSSKATPKSKLCRVPALSPGLVGR